MGVNIDIEGRLDDPTRLHELLRHCRERCSALGWPYEEVQQQVTGQAYAVVGNEILATDRPGVSEGRASMSLQTVDTRVQGLIIKPPDTASLPLTFDDTGRLVEYRAMPGRFETPAHGFGLSLSVASGYWLETPGAWIATTGAVQTHIRIIELLRELKAAFMSGLEVYDGGDFWETGDEDQLASHHRRMQSAIELFREPAAAGAILERVGIGTRDEAQEPQPAPQPPGKQKPH